MKRQDARLSNELRPVNITRNFIKYAEGSCLIEFGSTKVICTATAEESVPPFLRDKALGWVTAEYGMIPRSCAVRVPRDKSSGRSYEIQRLVGRSLRAVTNLKELGPRTIWLDCDVIQADGGTRAASITGSFISLAFALEKLRKSGIIQRIPLKEFVAAVSVGIMENTPILDLTYEEDSRAEVDMNVVMAGGNEFIEVQGTAEKGTFSKEKMDELLSLAQKGIKELIEKQRKQLKDIPWP